LLNYLLAHLSREDVSRYLQAAADQLHPFLNDSVTEAVIDQS